MAGSAAVGSAAVGSAVVLASHAWILRSAGQQRPVAKPAATTQQPRPIQGHGCEAAALVAKGQDDPSQHRGHKQRPLRPVGAGMEVPHEAGVLARLAHRAGAGRVRACHAHRAEAHDGAQHVQDNQQIVGRTRHANSPLDGLYVAIM